METSQLICSTHQWTGFYMITTSVTKELTLIKRVANDSFFNFMQNVNLYFLAFLQFGRPN